MLQKNIFNNKNVSVTPQFSSHATAHLTFSILLAPPVGLSAISASTTRCISSSVHRPMQSRGRRASLFDRRRVKSKTSRVNEVTLKFWGVTASVVGANSPLFGWIRLDVELNKDFSYSSDDLVWTVGVTVNFTYWVAYLKGTVSFGIPRLICVSFGITRLICASFGITRLICASDGITRLINVRVWRGADQRGERRMCEGHMNTSSFFMLPLTEMPPRRGTCRGGRGGQGRGAGRVQPERFSDLIMHQLSPAAPTPTPVVPQVVPDQLSCPEDQKVQYDIFMLIDKGTAWWVTIERMLGGDMGQITWKQFKESFYTKFSSASLRDAKWQEFLNLE
ncbi:ty3-gypsy retrotransposon protein [Cucumis melo var. makuwa]|uniref:Ty3-gypsy retrotransposon protein n=1 Tax=Cucumis melo var. makuwa TaxID=1194695 RepID=A0A5A7U8R1_CUCMM|nr:ty3-gypsy retrotransposon protein [Cucumis melo var. makuwa]